MTSCDCGRNRVRLVMTCTRAFANTFVIVYEDTVILRPAVSIHRCGVRCSFSSGMTWLEKAFCDTINKDCIVFTRVLGHSVNCTRTFM